MTMTTHIGKMQLKNILRVLTSKNSTIWLTQIISKITTYCGFQNSRTPVPINIHEMLQIMITACASRRKVSTKPYSVISEANHSCSHFYLKPEAELSTTTLVKAWNCFQSAVITSDYQRFLSITSDFSWLPWLLDTAFMCWARIHNKKTVKASKNRENRSTSL